ncbi:MAG: glycoside hydrolase family 97 protein [Muribaculaceae bacterium]|nr:glycoside hydrolase family 97 protein [Muribaculaceae bacterium]
MKRFLHIAAMAALAALPASALDFTSPSGVTVLHVADGEHGAPVYSIDHAGRRLVEASPLGVNTLQAEFAKGLRIADADTARVHKEYSQSRIKHDTAVYDALRAVVKAVNEAGDTLGIEFSVADNDVAFRYLLPRLNGGETGAITVTGEASGFAFPAGTTAFLTQQSDAMVGWKRTKPSYEEEYMRDVPVGTPSYAGHGFTFPALFRVGDAGWVLLGETGVDSRYVGSHLSEASHEGVYSIAFPMAEENNGNGDTSAAMALPAATPWRTITLGSDLAPIVETTVTWDLVDPLYDIDVPAHNGRGTWSWIIWQDASSNMQDQKTYVDFARDMGYEHVLVDAGWDVNPGYDGTAELVRYAADRGVGIFLWFSSSGWWNDIVQSPVNVMSNSIARKKAMKWMKELGVKGIKVDFFGGDKQETMRLYEDILSDAAQYGLSVIFHGCTMPRGWERMYPNYVGSEATLASENMVFSQHFADNVEAPHAALHPFVRNSLGCMEYGGTILNKRVSRSNASGVTRRSGDAFQLATAVLYQNPVQNFALAPNNLTDAPAAAIEFMKEVPTTWNETRFVDGYPGSYAVISRRHGDKWYTAGVNATAEVKELLVPVPGAAKGDIVTVLIDTPEGSFASETRKVSRDGKVKVAMQPRGGFVIVK